MTDPPRIENLRHLEMLCESDTDRQLWQCLAEGAALDVRGSLANFDSPPWVNALQSLRWTREEFVSSYPISKANEGPSQAEREDALESADQRLTDEINLYLSRLFGGKEPMATKTKPAPKSAKPETDDELLAWSLGACFNSPPAGKELRELQEKGATDPELLEAIILEWCTSNDGSVRPYVTNTGDAKWGAAIWFDTATIKGPPSLHFCMFAPGAKGDLLKSVRRVLGITEPLEKEKSKKSTPGETDAELLKRSLVSADFSKFKKGATDDELLVAINQAWRMPLVKGPRKYTISTNNAEWGTAIWFDTLKQDGTPDHSTFSELSKAEFLRTVRDLFNVNFLEDTPKHETNGHADETQTARFETIKAKGKSQAKPAPQVIDQDDRAVMGPIEKFSVAKMSRSPYQTRSEPTAEWLEELGKSMQTEGQLQPCLVRPNGELIAGHTRCEAAKLIKWKELDVRIVTCDDATARRLVLVDNAKRKDLNERERCQAYCELMAEYKTLGRTQVQLATKLGIDETTLSNILRLQSLPDALWERYESKGLSVDQLRALTVHAGRPKFVTAFLNYLEKGCYCKKDEQPENSHFDSAFERGISSAFRTMKKDSWGGGCQFTPTDEERQLLEIVEVKRRNYGGHTEKMAANVNLWNKLNQAAKKKAKEREQAKANKSAASPNLKAAAKVEAQRREQERLIALDGCWHLARSQAIAARFAKPRKQDYPAAVRLRMLICQEDSWQNSVCLDVLICPEAEFMTAICKDVHEWFSDDRGADCEAETVEMMVEWLQVDPVPFWKADESLLNCCTPDELQELAQEFDLPEDQTANDLVEALVKKWPAGHLPTMFCLEKPEPKKSAKKAKAK